MGFVVTRPLGTKDAEFEAYVRLLRQQGKDIANLPRAPDPTDPRRRWVYVWATRDEAQRFALDLKQQTHDAAWYVEETAAPPSEGPFGPLLIQLARRSDGLSFALHPLSLAMLRKAFPAARPSATEVFIDLQTWTDFQTTMGSLDDLVASILPTLTGLNPEQWTDLGYAVIDADTNRTWVYLPPAELSQNPA